MLIIAIPKSGSTSLLYTLNKLHNIIPEQKTKKIRKSELPSKTKILHKYHSDIRELTPTRIKTFNGNQKKLFKQHIPPTNNNILLLKNVKKVILVRSPEEIIEAYYRAEIKGLHHPRKEFKHCNNIKEWKQEAHINGLHDDLEWFLKNWKKEHLKNDQISLLITYSELIKNPKKTVNKIEKHFGLEISNKVTLEKKRYSRCKTGVLTNKMKLRYKRIKKELIHIIKNKKN